MNVVDLGLMKSVFFTTDPHADLNGDGIVNVQDLGLMKSMFLQSPGPTGWTPIRFVDNGNGTVNDNMTGLQWEKKSQDGSVHDQDRLWSYSHPNEPLPNGTVYTEFLPQLNPILSEFLQIP